MACQGRRDAARCISRVVTLPRPPKNAHCCAQAGARSQIEILRKQPSHTLSRCGSDHAEPRNAAHGAAELAASVFWGSCGVMRAQGGHWLDYDSVALAVLAIGLGIVVLVALTI